MDLDGRAVGKELGNTERGTHNQDIICETKVIFNKIKYFQTLFSHLRLTFLFYSFPCSFSCLTILIIILKFFLCNFFHFSIGVLYYLLCLYFFEVTRFLDDWWKIIFSFTIYRKVKIITTNKLSWLNRSFQNYLITTQYLGSSKCAFYAF